MEKKLYKSRTDKKICGVCAGIADYFDIDSSIVRLITILLILSGGIGVLPYIIAAIILPEEPVNDTSFSSKEKSEIADAEIIEEEK